MKGGAELGQGTSDPGGREDLVTSDLSCSSFFFSASVAAAIMTGSSGKTSSMPLFTTVLENSS